VSIELDGQPESVKRLLYVLASRNKPLSEAATGRSRTYWIKRTRWRQTALDRAGGMTQSGFSRLKKEIAGRQPGY
jgi:hypothetical protein